MGHFHELGMSGEIEELCSDPLPFARNYQLEALEKAIKENTIVYLDTGSGKTMIAIMLLRSYAHSIRKPSPFFAVFLVPTVVLVTQQAEAITMHTDLKVAKYWGEMGVDFWDAAIWKQQQDDYEVLVMTPMILLDALRHSFLNLENIKVMIFDECHNARGKHPYARLMKEFYHPNSVSKKSQLPRIFGMTASPIKAKGSKAEESYWKEIHDLENLMNSKVYTCQSESVLAQYITFATPKVKIYKYGAIPCGILESLESDLKELKEKHQRSLDESDSPLSVVESARKRISKLHSNLRYCINELGIWSALKAAESITSAEPVTSIWEQFSESAESAVRRFCLAAAKVLSNYLPPDASWSSCGKESKLNAGYLTSKVFSLLESLHEYRDSKDVRCIIFVERILTAVVLRSLLRDEFSKLYGWTTEHMAGYNAGMPLQSKKFQNEIVERFRQGTVNIIVATSILEEGLDVQSCNLVIRFDLPVTICGFIQSRGRARMQNSDFILMVSSDDTSALNIVNKFLASGEKMRQEVLSKASVPCEPLDLCKEVYYKVEATGAFVSLTSSIAMLHFYCSRLPSDGYFKPHPRCVVDEDNQSCTLYLPKSCPIPTVVVHGDIKSLKQFTYLEACKQLHIVGALTDYLVPDILKAEDFDHESGFEHYNNEHPLYLSPELIHYQSSEAETVYYCYMVELHDNVYCDARPRNFVLAMRYKYDFGEESVPLNLDSNGSGFKISISYVGDITLTCEKVLMCQKFQVTLFRILFDHNLKRLHEALAGFDKKGDSYRLDYLILPASDGPKLNLSIDWDSVGSTVLPNTELGDRSIQCFCGHGHAIYTMSGLVCSCILKRAIVWTPHNGRVYYISGELDGMNAEACLEVQDGKETTYLEYYEKRHGISLRFKEQQLLLGKHLNVVQNHLNKSSVPKRKGRRKSSVELPPELICVLFSPISLDTISSFSYVPSVMHRLEGLLLASKLKKMCLGHCTKNVTISNFKVMEALTTKSCQETFHLESLETLGDSFLKYAVSQQLFKANNTDHEGILSIRRKRIICNNALCNLGCERQIPGFIRDQPFDPQAWIIPGDNSEDYILEEEILSPEYTVYKRGSRKITRKRVADVVEALIGVFFSEGGELLALSFMEWLGIKVDFVPAPYERMFSVAPERYLNVKYLEERLNYSFKDPSLLLEALTHGSYMVPEIPKCYQRLEFIGDSVLDFLVTVHLYNKYPGLSPGLLTDLRSASVNNECYAQSALKAELHKHLLHSSQELHRQLAKTVSTFQQSPMDSTFGFDSEISLPKVLGDVVESLAGAILVDSNYDTSLVFRCMRPLLEPLVTPETMKLHPVRELYELCRKENYIIKKSRENGKFSVEVDANGVTYEHSSSVSDKDTAKKLACRGVLELLKRKTHQQELDGSGYS